MRFRLLTRWTFGILLWGVAIGFPLSVPFADSVVGQEQSVDLSQVENLNLPEAEPAPASPPAPATSQTGVESPETATESVEDSADSSSAIETSSDHPFLDLVMAGGWIGLVIFLLSLGAGAVAIRLFWLLRRSILLPSVLFEEFGAAIEKGKIQVASEVCRRHPSFMASILTGGLKNIEGGWEDVEKGLEETLASETARLYRKTDILSVVGNIAPMLGLLGTVLGMVAAFGELAASDGLGRFANLAQGIYFALVTTVDGLLAAIPSLTIYAFFNHRIAGIAADAADSAEHLMAPVKRYFQTLKPNSSSVTPPVTSTPSRPVNPPHMTPSRSTTPPPVSIPPAISVTERRRFSERNDAE